MKLTRIYKAIINLVLVVLCNTINAQTDPDFLNFKKLADDCFNKADYACAEKNYRAASIIKENDTFCKQRITESQTKRANQKKQAEARRREEERLEEMRLEDDRKKEETEKILKAEREEKIKIINEISEVIKQVKETSDAWGNNGYNKHNFDVLSKYENKPFFWDEANYILGKMYSVGNPIKQDYVKAREYFNKSIAYDNSKYELALLYKNGPEIFINKSKALELFYSAAQSGNSEAIHEYALMKLNGEGGEKDYNEAFQWFDKNKGHLPSIPYLAYMYYNGFGVAENKGQAFIMFRVSKESYLSKRYLAWMYYYGQVTTVDYETSFSYCKETEGDSDSQFLLAKLYMSDLEIKISFLESLALKILYNRDFLLNQKLTKQETVKLAEYYLNKAIDNNNSNAKKWTIISGTININSNKISKTKYLSTVDFYISNHTKPKIELYKPDESGFFAEIIEDLPEHKIIYFRILEGAIIQVIEMKKSHTDILFTWNVGDPFVNYPSQTGNKTIYLD